MDMIAEVMGTDSFDEDAMTDKIGSILVKGDDLVILVKGDDLVFLFNDGREETRTWVKPKRRGHKCSEAQKEHMRQVMKGKWPPERRAMMSKRMKELRKEHGDKWRRT